MTVARLRWWHLERVLPLEAQLFADEPWGARLWWSELGQVDSRHYVVALDGEEVLGYAGLADYPDEAMVQTVGVAPSAQGRGVGTLLVRDLLAEAGRRGHRRTTLEVRADNVAAQRLYGRLGFTRDGVRRGYYKGGPSGRTDAWLMTHRA